MATPVVSGIGKVGGDVPDGFSPKTHSSEHRRGGGPEGPLPPQEKLEFLVDRAAAAEQRQRARTPNTYDRRPIFLSVKEEPMRGQVVSLLQTVQLGKVAQDIYQLEENLLGAMMDKAMHEVDDRHVTGLLKDARIIGQPRPRAHEEQQFLLDRLQARLPQYDALRGILIDRGAVVFSLAYQLDEDQTLQMIHDNAAGKIFPVAERLTERVRRYLDIRTDGEVL